MTPLQAIRSLVDVGNSLAGLAGATADRVGATALPCVLVGAPTYHYGEFSRTEPDSLTFPVTVLVRLEGGAIERLLGFVGNLAAKIEEDTAAVVTDASPTSYDLGNQVTAAAYELTVEYPL